ncbi:MAG: dihydrodipicolinate synthase family protein [Clostridiales Family XIII bacterium]|jgi:4-hydroxy-2-oxoglutarate aldolase|nr:dihydrodipicolinate synthase family protein [Clostridiales Family XIII bacterium]
MKRFNGVYAPITTPFFDDETIAVEHLVANIRAFNKTALRGYMPLGSNGEFQGLTDRESFLVLDTVKKTAGDEKIIIGGCGRESAYKTLDFIRQVASYGLDFAFILPPHYFADFMTEDLLESYYLAVAEGSPIPIVVYNAPKFASGILLLPPLIRRLARHPNIIAMKNSSLQPNTDYMDALPDDADFSIIAGNIKTFFPGLEAGAIGGVLSTASYLPDLCCELYERYTQGNLQRARELHEFLNMISAGSIGKHGVAGVKHGMDLRGMYGGQTRNPLKALDDAEKQRIRRFFEEHGLLP